MMRLSAGKCLFNVYQSVSTLDPSVGFPSCESLQGRRTLCFLGFATSRQTEFFCLINFGKERKERDAGEGMTVNGCYKVNDSFSRMFPKHCYKK